MSASPPGKRTKTPDRSVSVFYLISEKWARIFHRVPSSDELVEIMSLGKRGRGLAIDEPPTACTRWLVWNTLAQAPVDLGCRQDAGLQSA